MTRNVILVCLDTVRKDFYDEYCGELRGRSDVEFDHCRAASSSSLPSHASMMTGDLPHRHGVNRYSRDFSKLQPEDTFLADLPNHRSIGISANIYAGSAYGFDTLFDEFADISWTRRFQAGMDPREYVSKTDAQGLSLYANFVRAALSHARPLRTLGNAMLTGTDLLLSRLAVPNLLDQGCRPVLRRARRAVEAGPEPFVLFINLMDAHGPHWNHRGYDQSLHDVPNSWNSLTAIDKWDYLLNGGEPYRADMAHYKALYGAAIDYLDRRVSAFIDAVDASTEGETSVVVTADHGENLGHPHEEGLIKHVNSLSEGVLHVPLSIRNPPSGYAPDESAYVSHTRLGDLIAGLAEGEPPDIGTERAAAEIVGSDLSFGLDVPNVTSEEQRYWTRMVRCVYEDETKWVWDSLGNATEYEIDRTRSCWQRRYRAEAHIPPWTTQFFDVDMVQYLERIDEEPGAASLDEHTRNRLEELGYL